MTNFNTEEAVQRKIKAQAKRARRLEDAIRRFIGAKKKLVIVIAYADPPKFTKRAKSQHPRVIGVAVNPIKLIEILKTRVPKNVKPYELLYFRDDKQCALGLDGLSGFNCAMSLLGAVKKLNLKDNAYWWYYKNQPVAILA